LAQAPIHTLGIIAGNGVSASRCRFGGLWYSGPEAASNAIDYAKFYSHSYNAVIRVYGEVGNVIDRHAHAGEFKEP